MFNLGVLTGTSFALSQGPAIIAKVGSLLPQSDPIDNLTTDLTEAAGQRRIRPAYGRANEIDRLVGVVKDRMAILAGKPGVGKTAIVEKFAWLIANEKLPLYKGYKVIKLNLRDVHPDGSVASLVDTFVTGGGKIKLRSLFEQLINSKEKIILFIDELQILINDFPGLFDGFEEQLARAEIPIIAASMNPEFIKTWIESHHGFKRRIETITIEELSDNETRGLLKEGRSSLIDRKNLMKASVYITDGAIEAVVELSQKISEWEEFVNPDRSLKLLREATAVAVNRALSKDQSGTISITYRDITDYVRRQFPNTEGVIAYETRQAQRESEGRRAEWLEERVQELLVSINRTSRSAALSSIEQAAYHLQNLLIGNLNPLTSFLIGPDSFGEESVGRFLNGYQDRIQIVRCSLKELCEECYKSPGLLQVLHKLLTEYRKDKKQLIIHITEAEGLAAFLGREVSPPPAASVPQPSIPLPAQEIVAVGNSFLQQFGVGPLQMPSFSGPAAPKPIASPVNDVIQYFAGLIREGHTTMIINVPTADAPKCPQGAPKITIEEPSYFEVIAWLKKQQQPSPDWIEELVFVVQALDVHRISHLSLADCCGSLFDTLLRKPSFQTALPSAIVQITKTVNPEQVRAALQKKAPFIENEFLKREENRVIPISDAMKVQFRLLASEPNRRSLWVQETSEEQIEFRKLQIAAHLMGQQKEVRLIDSKPLLDNTLSEEIRGAYLRRSLANIEGEFYLIANSADLKLSFLQKEVAHFLTSTPQARLICVGKTDVLPSSQPQGGNLLNSLSSLLDQGARVQPAPQLFAPYPETKEVSEPWTQEEQEAFIQRHLEQTGLELSDPTRTVFKRIYRALLGGEMAVTLSYDQLPGMIRNQVADIRAKQIQLDTDAIYSQFADFFSQITVNDCKFEVDPMLTPFSYRIKKRATIFSKRVAGYIATPFKWAYQSLGGYFASTLAWMTGTSALKGFARLFQKS